MRIISDFRDYYDSIQAYGLDGYLLYLRKQATVEVAVTTLIKSAPNLAMKPWHGRSFIAKSPNKYRAKVVSHYVLIGYCGRFFPMIGLAHYEAKRFESGTAWVYASSSYYYAAHDLRLGIARLSDHFDVAGNNAAGDKYPIEERHSRAFEAIQSSCEGYEDHTLFRLLETPIFCCGFTKTPS